jgi:hypothetical protein
MTPQIEKLSALLTRVQQNRQKPRRVATPVAQAAAAPARVAPAERPARAAPAELEERHVVKGSPPPPPPPQPVRRPAVDRRPTPLEMAVAGELDREQPTGPMAAPEARPLAAPAVDPRREPPVRSVRPATTPIEPPAAPQAITPRFIEPDPPREATRPIVQVVSKHAPPADATFGAMLKRSLSLRPH